MGKKGNAEDRLLKSAAQYIASKGGLAVAIGGIEIQEWPGERPHCYRLAVRFTGRKPPAKKI